MNKIICEIEEYFDNEAKRIIPLIYDENDLLGFKTEDIKKNIDPRILNYYINIQLRLFGYVELYKTNKDLTERDTNIADRLDYYEEYYQYRIREENIDLKLIANVIYDYLDNEKLDNLCYVLNAVETMAKKLIKAHNDSVDYLTIIYLFEK